MLSANKKQVNLYILTVGLLAEDADDLAGISQSKCVLRFTFYAEVVTFLPETEALQRNLGPLGA